MYIINENITFTAIKVFVFLNCAFLTTPKDPLPSSLISAMSLSCALCTTPIIVNNPDRSRIDLYFSSTCKNNSISS